jgi:hypothetical protein
LPAALQSKILVDHRPTDNGPKEQIDWTLPQGWTPFLTGHAVMEPTWGDLPTLAQDRARSRVQGRVGATPIPGTTDAFNPITGQRDKFPLNVVGNTNGGSWHCVIIARVRVAGAF